MSTSRAFIVVGALTLAALTAASWSGHGSDPSTRSCGPVLGQEVCTLVRMDGGRVAELVATIPLALIEGVPLVTEMTWPPAQMAAIPLPERARTSLGIDHLGINWEAHGHPPGPFLTPHFDFHFYNVTRERLGTLDCSDVSKPAVLPGGYALPDIDVPGLGMLHGLCVPTMGMHAVPADDLELEGPFSASMLVGYYQGKPIFIEPMVTRERLLRRSSFTLSVPKVEVPEGVRYPRAFEARYDARHDRYDLILSGFDDR